MIQIWAGVTEVQTQASMYSLIQPTPNKTKCEKKEMKLPILETEGCGWDRDSMVEHSSSLCKALGPNPLLQITLIIIVT